MFETALWTLSQQSNAARGSSLDGSVSGSREAAGAGGISCSRSASYSLLSSAIWMLQVVPSR